jgi:hypothetical protein
MAGVEIQKPIDEARLILPLGQPIDALDPIPAPISAAPHLIIDAAQRFHYVILWN